MAMGKPGYPPVNIPIPTKIGSKMGSEFTCPKMLPLVLKIGENRQVPQPTRATFGGPSMWKLRLGWG